MVLSQFILENIEEILSEWEKFAKSIPSAAEMNSEGLRNDAARILTTIAHDMARSQTPDEQTAKSKGQAFRAHDAADTAAETHSGQRHGSGFDLNELVSEYRALRASVVHLWTRQLTALDGDALYDLTRFNEGIDQALSESIAEYTALRERSRELFLGVLGHDLRTPIGVVLTSANVLAATGEAGSAQAKAASLILSSGKRISQMVADLLDVTHTRLGGSLPIELQRVDLAAMCQQAIDEMRALHPQRPLIFNMSGDLYTNADASRIAQLLSNLLQNAVQHGLEGTPITVSLRGEKERIVLTVHNEGAPISESARERIFEPLVRGERRNEPRSSRSLGLGLYIAREIATAHGGSIEVKSARDEGTTFTASLPRR